MAAVTARAIVWTTTAGAKTTGSFTPASGELLVAVVGVAGTDTAPTMSDSLSGGWTLVDSFRSYGSAITGGLRIYCRNSAVTGAAMTVTMTPSGDTGGGLAVLSVTNPGAFGASAVAGNGGQADQAAATPAPVLDSTPSAVNPVIVAVMTQTNGSANSTVRSGFTEDYDQGFGSPASGLEVQHRNSGETSATLTLGGAAPSGFASIGVEIPVTQSVSAGVASEADSGPAGTVSQPTLVAGGVAQEADTAPVGGVRQVYTAPPAAEADSAPAGQPAQVYTAGLALEADAAIGGAVIQPQIISGGVAAESSSAPAGQAREVYLADTAAEADSSPSGQVGQTYTASPPAESDSAPAGQAQQIYTAASAAESDTAPGGQATQVYTASPAGESDAVPPGSVSQAGASTTVNGGVAGSSESVPPGSVVELYLAPTVSEADAALAGQVLQAILVSGGVASESNTVLAGAVSGGGVAGELPPFSVRAETSRARAVVSTLKTGSYNL